MHILCLVNQENCPERIKNLSNLAEYPRNYNYAKRWAPTEILRHFQQLSYENYIVIQIFQAIAYPFNYRHNIIVIPYHRPPPILFETERSKMEQYIEERRLYNLVKNWEEDEIQHLEVYQTQSMFIDEG